MVRLSERISQGPIHRQSTGRPDAFRDFREKREGHRGDAGLLDCALDQSDRLVAHRSNRRQQNRIHTIFPKPARNFRRTAGNQATRRGNRSHDAEMPRRRLTGNAGGHQFL
jgi:hypothetical protein